MTIHVGLIGGGSITSTHARACAAIPDAKIVAFCGANPQKIEQLCHQFGGSAYTDLNSFLKHPSLEMVIIGSPSGLHAEQGMAAAQRGLHVLVEKPIDITTSRADALLSECQKAGVKLGVIFQDRLRPGIRQLKQLIVEGRLGKLLLADAKVKWYRAPEYYSGSRWRGTWKLDGGGALMNQGVHTVDLLLWLLGDVTTVEARTRTLLHSIQTEDTAIALLEFSSGALGVLQATTAAYPGYARRVEITGTEGTVILENDLLITTGLRNAQPNPVTNQSPDQNASAASPLVDDIRGHQRVIEDFIGAIRNGGTPACDGHEGRRSVALIERIYAAFLA
ncbi:MAG TPA: Gfo/Idh/MocA family oxidoreductase [Candidatus Angelobacter sp.]|jgi:predicted dehydrogenase|nr:Gfo/Idh/MocA family oxidoreductase [Candidatus Angelobacter sp.]